MLNRLVASALIAAICLSTKPAALAQQTSPMVTVPAGTVVPLTLVSPIKSRSTKPGDTVRASVAFPVTVGDRIAIPPGTYVEGVLGQPLPKVKHQPDPGVQIHFTRLVFANGYSAPLDATQVSLLPAPLPPSPAQPPATMLTAAFHALGHLNPLDAVAPETLTSPLPASRISFMAQTAPALPPLPPLPHEGPAVGLVVGLGVGVPAALILLAILFHHKGGSSDSIVHDAGWQFQMRLAAPLTLDTSQIAPAPPANLPVK
jgi:hypothetical protein